MPQSRITMDVPDELMDDLMQEAESRGITVQELMKKFMKLGFLAINLEKSPDTALLIRDVDGDRELLL